MNIEVEIENKEKLERINKEKVVFLDQSRIIEEKQK